jgi:NAD(P)-dependent dehydrogenase (short-subunit alcohol dehydrogenase family)
MSQPQQKYALILGCSSGFGAATGIRLAREGYHIFGVHLDRKATMPKVEETIRAIESQGVKATFFNANAADPNKQKEIADAVRAQIPEGQHLKVVLHSLAFGTLKKFIDEPANALTRANLEMTLDVMANSLPYWTQELYWRKLLGFGSRIYAMTSHGADKAVSTYGAVSAAKASLEAYCRQLALELGKVGTTINAIRAGVTVTPALEKIPGSEYMIKTALYRNPAGRLTTPEDVANAIVALSDINAQWINGDTIAVDNAENYIDG